jgi:hypothetical protein
LLSVQISAKINQTCQVVCKRQYKADEVAQFAEKIRQEYRVHWYPQTIIFIICPELNSFASPKALGCSSIC